MGNVLISLDKEHEVFLRKMAQERGMKKGAISEVIMQALDKLKAEQQNRIVKERLIKRMKEGFDFNYTMYKKRSEIYD